MKNHLHKRNPTDLIVFIFCLALTIPVLATDNCLTSAAPYCIELISPKGGEEFNAGQPIDIIWEQKGIDKVSIGWKNIPSSLNPIATISIDPTVQKQTYAWTIPITQAGRTDLKIDILGYQTNVGQDHVISKDFSARAECVDTDSGNDLLKAGEASIAGQGFFDYCDTTTSIVEATCGVSGPEQKTSVCPTNAPYCSNGACTTTPNKCTDTDGGDSPTAQGTITEARSYHDTTHTDYCEDLRTFRPLNECTGDSCGLREYYCVDDSMNTNYRDVACPQGCHTGRCATPDFPTKEKEKTPDVKPSTDYPSILTDMQKVRDDDAVLGVSNAPLVMVEFGDYECPFCERFYTETFPQIKEKYIDTGRLMFVFRDMPLSFHEHAQSAAEAAECAGEQGKYFEMHDRLFEDGVSGGRNAFLQYAKTLKLDTSAFEQCLQDEQTRKEVNQDAVDAAILGIRGTPTFIINGQVITGAVSFDVFEEVFEGKKQYPTIAEPAYPSTAPIYADPKLPPVFNEPAAPTSATCNGCFYEQSCLSFGARIVDDGKGLYCSYTKQFEPQRAIGDICEENHQCQSNECGDGKCYSLQGELEETRGLIQQFFDWIKNVFG